MPEESEIRNFFDARIEQFSDRSARWLFQDRENVRGLIEIVEGELVDLIDFSQIVQLNRSFVPDNLREQESDIVFRVPFQSESDTDELLIYILIEHQSTVDPTMGFRVLFYMTQIWDSQRREWESQSVPKGQWRFRPILPIVFYTGEQRWTTPLTLDAIMDIPDVLSRFVPKFDTLFLGVKDTDESELTKFDHPLGWLLTVLQKEQATVEALSEALIEALSHINTLDEASAQQRRRAISYLLLLILHRRPFEEHPELTRLLGQHVQEASDRVEVELMAQTMAEHLIEQGIEQGKAQGIEQGEIKAKQADVLKILRHRFDTVPASLSGEINSIRSLPRLDALLERVLTANTLDEIDLKEFDG
ncbi:MAG: Rpn family recombination-promoting nuclease/putative transposase [Candidatus Poribacteria bacterium]|nr:Rpn family recombination-promoting nuclease/putative transposase [Candidatus Poribacteria bacterium]